jgi:hypothetical protein
VINLQEKGAKKPKDWLIWEASDGQFHFGLAARGVMYSLGKVPSQEVAQKLIQDNYKDSIRIIAVVNPKPGVRTLAITRAIARELGLHRIEAGTIA